MKIQQQSMLQIRGLKQTGPRRMIIAALQRVRGAIAPYDLQEKMAKCGQKMNAVTIYRVLRALEEHGIVHRHPCDGHYSLCTLPDQKGHHGFLHCHSCGKIDEFADERLCKIENQIARSAKFKPHEHVSEITGVCASCLS